MTKRLSFTDYDVFHIYDLCLSNFQEGCPDCEHLKKRLERFLGEDEVETIKKMNKEHPYNISKKDQKELLKLAKDVKKILIKENKYEI